MKNSKEQKQQKVQQVKKERNMTNNVIVKEFGRKLGTVHQQNLIELFETIYHNPNEYTYCDLAYEMTKSKRAIQRMVEDINTFCPNLITSKIDINGKVHLKVFENVSEAYLDSCFKRTNNAPLLYIYLVMMLNRFVTIQDIMQKLNIKECEAKKIVKKLFEASTTIDVAEDDNDEIIFGNLQFVKKFLDTDFLDLLESYCEIL